MSRDQRAYAAKYRADNPEKVRNQRREYYCKNREKILERMKKYRVVNRERSRLNDAKRYYANREKKLESARKYYAENLDKRRKYRAEHPMLNFTPGAIKSRIKYAAKRRVNG
jgi:hypothetical protein